MDRAVADRLSAIRDIPDGPGPIEPGDIYWAPTVTLNAIPATFQGPQPGVALSVSGKANGCDTCWVEVDGRTYPAALSAGNWTATVRFFRSASFQVKAWGRGLDSDSVLQTVQSAPRAIAVTLVSAVPDVTVQEPASGTVNVPAAGLKLQVKARTSDGFGTRTMTWELGTARGGMTPEAGAYIGQVDVPPVPLGARQLVVRCQDEGGNVGTATVNLQVQDASPPTFQITQPAAGQSFPLLPGSPGVAVVAQGTAADTQSGMVSPGRGVEWSLDGGATWTAATTTDGWATWKATLPALKIGSFTLQVRAVDRAGNVAQVQPLAFQVVSGYRPASLEERLSERSYLAALVATVRDHVKLPSGGAPSSEDLGALVKQPVAELSQPVPAGADPAGAAVHELRLVIEEIRRLLPGTLVAAQWSFDGAPAAGPVPDLSGNNCSLRLNAGATLDPGLAGGKALSLDGVARSGIVDPTPALQLGADNADFSLAFFVQLRQGFTGAWRNLVHKGTVDTERTPAIWLTPNANKLHARVSTTVDANAGIDESVATLEVGRWTHVAYVKEGNELRLYVDGKLDSRVTLRGPTVANNGPLHIGKDPWSAGVNCLIDDPRVYRLGLSSESVAQLAAGPPQAAPASALAAGQATYRQTAYEALLAAVGTSYDELRMIRGATPEQRRALAERLGIRLTAAAPDELERLRLDGAALTDAALETLFGLRDTDPAKDPLRPAATPALLQWRTSALTATWSEQDHRWTRAYPVIVDPDLVGSADLTPAGAAGTPGRLLTARTAELKGWADRARQLRTTTAPAAAAFVAVVADALPALDRAKLDAAVQSGADVTPQLTAAGVPAAPVLALARVARLARTGTVTENEWRDVEAIAVQLKKTAALARWRQEEGAVSLAPELFRAGAAGPALPPWRADAAARAEWQDVLRARIAEMQALVDGYADMLAAVDEVSLPLLRDAVIGAFAGVPVARDAADWLSDRLFVDVAQRAATRTSRVRHATDTVQGALFALRAGRLATGHPAAAWTLADPALFDLQWRWMGSFDGWVSAMLAFLQPEGNLDPELRVYSGGTADASARTAVTPHFEQLVRTLRAGGRLSRESARTVASSYLAPLLDTLQASLPRPTARWRLDENQGAGAADSAGGSQGTLAGATWAAGRFGAGLAFDGASARVNIAAQPGLNGITNTFTLSFWAYPEAPHEVDAEATTGASGTSGQRYAYGPAQGTTRFGPGHAGVGVSVGTNGVSVYEHGDNYMPAVLVHQAPLRGWTHVAVVYQDRRPRLYVDGVLVRSSETQSAMTVHPAPDGFGGLGSGFFRGRMDDIRTYSAALTAEQVDLLAFQLTEQRTDLALDRLRGLSERLLTPLSLPAPPYLRPEAGWLSEVFLFVPLAIAQRLRASDEHLAALDWFRSIYSYNRPPHLRKVHFGLTLERNVWVDAAPRGNWAVDLNPHTVAVRRSNPYTRYMLMALAAALLDFGDREFARESGEAIARARELYETARDVLSEPDLDPPAGVQPSGSEPVFPSPALVALRLRPELQLAKIRQGRNIAGMRVAAPQLQAGSGLAGSAGGADALRPTPYRYRVILDRSRQLVAHAQQIEAAYLSALTQFDEARYRREEAAKGLELSRAGVELQQRRVAEAKQGQAVASRQVLRAEGIAGIYQDRIDAPLSAIEKKIFDDIWHVNDLRVVLGGIDAAIGMAGAAAQIANISEGILSMGVSVGASVAQAAGHAARGVYSGLLSSAESRLQSDQMVASYERQRDDWRMQQRIVNEDKLVADAQAVLADDQYQVALQEQVIAGLQSAHAQATVDLLDRQFTNAELFEWMSGVLGGVYRYFLQQAAAMARLAQHQLAFERQEPAPAIVQADYWQPPETSSDADRRGLTGSARLLQDIEQLDQFAFDSDRRKLNLTQSFSLAGRLPMQFAELRSTGVLRFATPMDWFDESFPGHYLRLIKRVRLSLAALVPPGQGIRATLSASGVSRVVTGGDAAPLVIHRSPDMVALTSAVGASGVFELDEQADMLRPFEAMGVATEWELALPKAANALDFSSIADVVLTIEYTALHDDTYRSQVVSRLNASRTRGGDRALSIRRDFADAWYALHDPAGGTTRTATLDLVREDFPTQLDQLRVGNVALYAVPAGGDSLPAFGVTLLRDGRGGQAQAAEGVISTRAANAPAWGAIRDATPVGPWSLTVDDRAVALLDGGDIEDLMLIVGYEGQAPAWPT